MDKEKGSGNPFGVEQIVNYHAAIIYSTSSKPHRGGTRDTFDRV